MRRLLTTTFLIGLTTGAAQASQVYFNDFDGGLGLGGAGAIVGAQGYDGVNGIAGSFWFNDTRSLASTFSLSGLGAHDWLTLSFDIAFIDSWDGAIGRIFGDDFLNIVVDGATRLITTNFGGLGGELSDGVYGFFGFTAKYDDEAYRYSATLRHSASTADFSIFADGRKWQAGADESWAIDNLSVTIGSDIVATPLPASAATLLAGVGLLAGAGRRRRRTR